MESYTTFVSVLVDQGIDRPLDYAVPEGLVTKIRRGMQVKVPLRGRQSLGYVLEVKKTCSVDKVLPLHALLSENELLTEELLELGTWMARYYNAPLREIIKSLLPATVRRNHSHKEQFFVTKNTGLQELRAICSELQGTNCAQSRVIEQLLLAPSGLLLSELLEKAGVSRSPVDTLEGKGLIKVEKIRLDRSPLTGEEYLKVPAKKLNTHQKEALDKITQSIETRRFETHLLFGVTGSGKTEVYFQAMEYALKQGLTTILLVPEVALTGQTIERLRARFDDTIAILHHAISEGERFDEWHKIHRGEAKIIVGARSALFCPAKQLGLIIVDEEHENSYKQSDTSPCYHARDVAVMRGKINEATVILGSATPSLESYYNAQIGKYRLLRLPSRAAEGRLPRVHVVDMLKEYERSSGFTCFSELLIDKIKGRLNNGEQTILFLNRRGYHTSLNCTSCGHIFKCPGCDLALTFHKGDAVLSCHLCDFRLRPPPKSCTQCKTGEALKYKGLGTEQLERALHALFPEARTLRIDRDTTRHKGSHERLLRQFQTQKADILVGTQMIAKGLHFPAVTLAAIINGDAGLHIPDFRASERVFQLITQVAGRAGRGELAGEVIIQTTMAENSTIAHGAHQAFESYYEEEIVSRKLFHFPPFTHLVKLTFSGKDQAHVLKAAERFRLHLLAVLAKTAQIHPIVPSGHPKIKEHFRFHCLLRCTSVYAVNCALQKTIQCHPLPYSVRLHIDVDTQSTYF